MQRPKVDDDLTLLIAKTEAIVVEVLEIRLPKRAFAQGHDARLVRARSAGLDLDRDDQKSGTVRRCQQTSTAK